MAKQPKPKNEPTGFGGKLKDHRIASGLTQQQIADATGSRANHIARIERGENEPGWPLVLAISKALDKTPNDFLPDGF